MLAQEFVRNALLAGSFVAVASGLVGYFLVVRTQMFAADALSHVSFTGAVAAAIAGVDLRLGLFGSTVLIALVFAVLGPATRVDDVTVGVVFAAVLGVGVLLLDDLATGNGVVAARTLFGSIFSLDASQARVAALVGAVVAVGMVLLARPLLFASLDPVTAAVRGVRVRAVGVAFLVLLALDAAEAAQAVGALLLIGLLAAPAGAALRLTASPVRALALAAGLALLSVWLGVALAYVVPTLPPSTAVVGVAAALYVAAAIVGRWAERGN